MKDTTMNTTQTPSNLVAIAGNTWPVKAELKAIGARWNPELKAWMIEPARAEQARQLVTSGSRAAGNASPANSAPRAAYNAPRSAATAAAPTDNDGPRVQWLDAGSRWCYTSNQTR